MAILSFFVKAPAWNIFLLLVLPITVSMVITSLTKLLIIARIGALLDFHILLLWQWSVCTLIHEKYSSYMKVPILWFKISIAYLSVYYIFIFLDFTIIPINYIEPLNLLFLVCNIYCLYFLSKLLVMVEKQSKVKFNEYIGTLVLAWILLVGIWYIQPRVNRIFLTTD